MLVPANIPTHARRVSLVVQLVPYVYWTWDAEVSTPNGKVTKYYWYALGGSGRKGTLKEAEADARRFITDGIDQRRPTA